MSLIKSGSTIVETPITNEDRVKRTGVYDDGSFAICDEVDPLKQIQFDASPQATNVATTIKAGAASSAVVITLPAITGTLATSANILIETIQYSAPTEGATVALAAGTQNLVLEPAGALNALTITLVSAPANGTKIAFMSTQDITALTLTAGGVDVVVNAPTAMTAGSPVGLIYRTTGAKWYKTV